MKEKQNEFEGEMSKPEIKFHVELDSIVHSGSGDVYSQEQVAEMLTDLYGAIDKYEFEVKKLQAENKELKEKLTMAIDSLWRIRALCNDLTKQGIYKITKVTLEEIQKTLKEKEGE